MEEGLLSDLASFPPQIKLSKNNIKDQHFLLFFIGRGTQKQVPSFLQFKLNQLGNASKVFFHYYNSKIVTGRVKGSRLYHLLSGLAMMGS